VPVINYIVYEFRNGACRLLQHTHSHMHELYFHLVLLTFGRSLLTTSLMNILLCSIHHGITEGMTHLHTVRLPSTRCYIRTAALGFVTSVTLKLLCYVTWRYRVRFSVRTPTILTYISCPFHSP